MRFLQMGSSWSQKAREDARDRRAKERQRKERRRRARRKWLR